jgi:hypothetical protein
MEGRPKPSIYEVKLHFPASNSKARRGIALSAVAVLLLVFAAPVAAAVSDSVSDDPSSAQYDSTAEQLAERAGSGGDSDGGGLNGRVVGALPFTGMDVVVVALAAVAVMGAGLALSRVTRPRTGNDEPRTR